MSCCTGINCVVLCRVVLVSIVLCCVVLHWYRLCCAVSCCFSCDVLCFFVLFKLCCTLSCHVMLCYVESFRVVLFLLRCRVSWCGVFCRAVSLNYCSMLLATLPLINKSMENSVFSVLIRDFFQTTFVDADCSRIVRISKANLCFVVYSLLHWHMHLPGEIILPNKN